MQNDQFKAIFMAATPLRGAPGAGGLGQITSLPPAFKRNTGGSSGGAQQPKRFKPPKPRHGDDEEEGHEDGGHKGSKAPRPPGLVAAGYRDLAAERRAKEGKEEEDDETNMILKLDAEQTKLLGGDENYTHLVKGLDVALAQKERAALAAREAAKKVADEERVEASKFMASMSHAIGQGGAGNKTPQGWDWKPQCHTALAQGIFQAVCLPKPEPLVAVAERFKKGRTLMRFDLNVDASQDIPTIVNKSKEDCPDPPELTVLQLPIELTTEINSIMEYFSHSSHSGRRRKATADSTYASSTSKSQATEAAAAPAVPAPVVDMFDMFEDTPAPVLSAAFAAVTAAAAPVPAAPKPAFAVSFDSFRASQVQQPKGPVKMYDAFTGAEIPSADSNDAQAEAKSRLTSRRQDFQDDDGGDDDDDDDAAGSGDEGSRPQKKARDPNAPQLSWKERRQLAATKKPKEKKGPSAEDIKLERELAQIDEIMKRKADAAASGHAESFPSAPKRPRL